MALITAGALQPNIGNMGKCRVGKVVPHHTTLNTTIKSLLKRPDCAPHRGIMDGNYPMKGSFGNQWFVYRTVPTGHNVWLLHCLLALVFRYPTVVPVPRPAVRVCGVPLWGFAQRALGCNRDVSINRIDEQHVGRAAAVVLAAALLLWKRMRNHGSSFKQAKSVANLDFKWFSVSASNKDRVQTGKPYLEAGNVVFNSHTIQIGFL